MMSSPLMKRCRHLAPQNIIDLLVPPVLPCNRQVQLLEYMHEDIVYRHPVCVALHDVDVPWQSGVVQP